MVWRLESRVPCMSAAGNVLCSCSSLQSPEPRVTSACTHTSSSPPRKHEDRHLHHFSPPVLSDVGDDQVRGSPAGKWDSGTWERRRVHHLILAPTFASSFPDFLAVVVAARPALRLPGCRTCRPFQFEARKREDMRITGALLIAFLPPSLMREEKGN